jgi:hypothetical protein
LANLLEQLGLDPGEFEWFDLALCRGMEIKSEKDDSFFDLYENDEVTRYAQDQMCLSCPVIRECFYAGMNGEYGVWGATYFNGQGKPDAAKNSHKTKQVWEEIYQKVKR